MCEVTLNVETYKAKSIKLSGNRDIQRQGDYFYSGRNAFRAVIIEFKDDMSFLKDVRPITISSSGEINLANQGVREIEINDYDSRIVTFILRN